MGKRSQRRMTQKTFNQRVSTAKLKPNDKEEKQREQSLRAIKQFFFKLFS